MSQLDGFFSLRTPRDLRDKLESDYARLLAADPTSKDAQYAAFDFFVCAEHLADWVKNASGGSLTAHRNYPDGQLVSHVANGAKHFRIDTTKHTVAKDTRVTPSAFQGNAFQNDAFQTGRLVIDLESGAVASVIDVATRVLSHWKAAVR